MEFYNVDHYHGHYVARNGNGDFVLSADTESEAWHELEMMDREWELTERSMGCRFCVERPTAVGCAAYGLHSADHHDCNIESCPLVHPELLIVENV